MTTHSADAAASAPHVEPAPAPAPAPAATLPALASGIPTSVFGFAVVITLLSLINTGILTNASPLLPAFLGVGFFVIGIGGLFEIRNGDVFGGTFGIAYAGFLLSSAITLRFFSPAADAPPEEVAAFGDALGAWFLLWAIIAVFFVVASLVVNTAALAAFVLLALVLLLLGLANIIGGDFAGTLTKAAGWFGLLNGVAAFWLAGGLLLNAIFGRDVVPLGAPRLS